MDHQIFLAINNLAGKNEVLDSFAVFLSGIFLYFFIAIVVGLWFREVYKDRTRVALVSALVSRGIVVELIKTLVDRPRPFELFEVAALIEKEAGKSFPSGHAVIFFSFAFAFYGTKWFWPFLALATLASLARVYTGIHFPSDILASVVIAAITVWGVSILFKKRILS